MRKKTTTILLCLLLLSTLVLDGCLLRPGPERTEEGETLFRLGFTGSPDTLNPYAAGSEEAAAVFSLLYDTLFSADLSSGEYVGNLCSEWTVQDGAAEGGKLWKLTLRPDVVWHDGSTLTASDVEFSLQSAKDFSTLFSYPELALLDTTGIAVEDDTHLAFLVWGDVPYMEELLSRVPILPRHVWNQAAGMEYNSSGVPRNASLARETLYSMRAGAMNMVGSGPYVWESWSEGVVTLRRNDSYWNGTPRPQVVELRFGCVSPGQMLRRGELDACWDLTADEYASLKKRNGFTSSSGTQGELYQIVMDLSDSDSPLASENVRKALDYCLDRKAVTACFGGGMPSIGYLTPYSPWYYADKIDYRRDPSAESASWLLDSAGYRDVDGDGVREAGLGRSLSFELLCSDSSPVWKTAAEAWRDSCALAGIQIRVKAVAPEELYTRLQRGEFELALTAERCYNDPFYSFSPFYWNGGANTAAAADLHDRLVSPGDNFTGFKSEDYDRLYRNMLTASGEARQELVTAMGFMLYDTAASLPIGFSVYRQTVSPSWYNIRAYRGTGLLFAPEILRQQFLTMTCPGRK